MKNPFHKIAAMTTFLGGAIIGLSFAQRKGSDFRSDVLESIKKGKALDVLSKEAQAIGKDIWQAALGMKDIEEVQEFISEAEKNLYELGEKAKKYGGEVAEVLSKKYEEIAKNITKQAKEMEKSAQKKIKKVKKDVTKKVNKVVKK